MRFKVTDMPFKDFMNDIKKYSINIKFSYKQTITEIEVKIKILRKII